MLTVNPRAILLALAATACLATPPGDRPADPDGREPSTSSEGAATLHEHQTFESGGLTRTYHFLEAAGHERTPKPLVVVLHGGGATIDAFLGRPRGASPMGAPWIALGRREGVHVLIPQGHGRQWNDCRQECRHCGTQDDVTFVVDLLDALSRRYGIDARRIYVVGESNGGFMTMRLATERPDLFAAFGIVTALMPANSDCREPAKPVSMAFIVGTEDPSTRYHGGLSKSPRSGAVRSAVDSLAAWTALGRCEAPTVETRPDLDPRDGSTVTVTHHACPATGHDVVLYAVDGAGHVPPSKTQRVSRVWESVVGRQNHDIETAEELWAFLRAHPKPDGARASSPSTAPEGEAPEP